MGCGSSRTPPVTIEHSLVFFSSALRCDTPILEALYLNCPFHMHIARFKKWIAGSWVIDSPDELLIAFLRDGKWHMIGIFNHEDYRSLHLPGFGRMKHKASSRYNYYQPQRGRRFLPHVKLNNLGECRRVLEGKIPVTSQYPCLSCPSIFNNSADLDFHSRRHSGRFRGGLTCSVCEWSTTRRRSMEHHSRWHSKG
jgi:hypothetical protein